MNSKKNNMSLSKNKCQPTAERRFSINFYHLKNRDLTKESGVLGDNNVMRRNHMKLQVSMKLIFSDDRMRNDIIIKNKTRLINWQKRNKI